MKESHTTMTLVIRNTKVD